MFCFQNVKNQQIFNTNSVLAFKDYEYCVIIAFHLDIFINIVQKQVQMS